MSSDAPLLHPASFERLDDPSGPEMSLDSYLPIVRGHKVGLAHRLVGFCLLLQQGTDSGQLSEGNSDLEPVHQTHQVLGFDQAARTLDIYRVIVCTGAMEENQNRVQLLAVLPFVLGQYLHAVATSSDEPVMALFLAWKLYPPEHPWYPSVVMALATAYMTRFEGQGDSGDVGDLDSAVFYNAIAAKTLPPGDLPALIEVTTNAAKACDSRVQQHDRHATNKRQPEVIVALLRYLQGVVDNLRSLKPPNNSFQRSTDALIPSPPSFSASENSILPPPIPDEAILSCQIGYMRHELLYTPLEESSRPTLLARIGVAYMMKYFYHDMTDDLNTAVSTIQEALHLHPSSDPTRALYLRSLGKALEMRHEKTGSLQDLQDSISCHRLAARINESGSEPVLQAKITEALASLHQKRAQLEDSMLDLSESIEYYKEAIAMRPATAKEEASLLKDLAMTLHERFTRWRDPHDIVEAQKYAKEALALTPEDHDLQYMSWLLGWQDSWDESRTTSAGDPKLMLMEKTVAGSYVDRIANLAWLGTMSGRETISRDDLNIAINYCEDALAKSDEVNNPSGFVDLATCQAEALCLRHKIYQGDSSDLDNAINIFRKARSILPTKNPLHVMATYRLGDSYMVRYRTQGNRSDLDSALEAYQWVTEGEYLPYRRLLAASAWAEGAHQHLHASSVPAYAAALSAMNQYIAIRQSMEGKRSLHEGRYMFLAMEAASCAISMGRLDLAVEFLEQGRGILWSQLGGLRTPLDKLEQIHPIFARDFRRLSKDLEGAVASSERLNARETLDYSAKAKEWERLVKRIQELDGFSGFLKPATFAHLQDSALIGPIILINMSRYRSDALIILRHGSPLLVELPGETLSTAFQLAVDLGRAVRGVQIDADKLKNDRILVVLRSLWKLIVGPITNTLKSICKLPDGSRIWWCPTSVLWRLPLHAAGPYTKGERNLPDIFVSSYTSTLSSLLNTFRRREENFAPAPQTLLVVGQEQTPGQVPLQYVAKEIEHIQEIVPSIKLLEGEQGTRDAVIDSLKECSWVHFTCHGRQGAPQPFDSCFALYDKPLRLLDIAQLGLPNAEFAFLSACHAATGDLAVSDEAIHMTGGLQSSGFGGVVGTLWAMADVDGPLLAREFYRYMFREGRGVGDYQDAAKALNLATKRMRREKVPVHRWINFVHFGA